MTRPADDVARVAAMLELGISQAEVARRSGIPRATLREWVRSGTDTVLADRANRPQCNNGVTRCGYARSVEAEPYAYLLGLYLGDGCISRQRPGVYRLRISLDASYPSIIDECAGAMARVLHNKVGRVHAPGCVSVNSYSAHWPCLFPQHAPGRKHLREIVLDPWQQEIALSAHPRLLLRGLIHSDGYRGENRIGGRYSYPRYMFSNRSADIRNIFMDACGCVGITATRCGQWQVSVARRGDVAAMDSFIGPKT